MRRRAIANPLAEDLDHVLARTEGLWEELRWPSLTGGSGFFGCWLLESLPWPTTGSTSASRPPYSPGIPSAFARRPPHLRRATPALELVVGDVTEFPFPPGAYSHVLHAATEARADAPRRSPADVAHHRGGTERTLEFAVQCGAARYLLTSSGAVYGKQPPVLTHLPED